MPFATCCLSSQGLKVTRCPHLWLGWEVGRSCQLGFDGFSGFCALFSSGRASLHDKASLRLEQVRSEDQGWYECKVLMLDQQYDTFHNGSWVHLTINGAYGPLLGGRGLPCRKALS